MKTTFKRSDNKPICEDCNHNKDNYCHISPTTSFPVQECRDFDNGVVLSISITI